MKNELADRIFLGGDVLTMDDANPQVEALAVQGDKIVAVGSRDEVLQWQGAETEIVDLGGKTLLPGFHEPHLHPTLSAVVYDWVDVSGFTYTTSEGVWNALREAAQNAEPGQWIFAFGWDPMIIPGLAAPRKQELDEIAPGNPLFVMQQNMHTCYVNSRAFELAGITRDTPDPGHGGFFERDAQGELTGKLIEAPAILPFVDKFGFPQSVEAWEELISAEYGRYAEMGITSVSSMGLFLPMNEMVQIYTNLSTQDPQVRHFVFIAEQYVAMLPDDPQPNMGNDYLRLKGVKFWYDGSPYTGSMLLEEPYLDTDFAVNQLTIPPGTVGHANVQKDALAETATEAARAGWQIAIHTQGDRASTDIMEVLKAVHQASSREDARHRLEHCVFVDPANYEDLARIGATVSFHLHHLYYYGEILRDHLVGPERSHDMLAVKTALDAGHRVTLHGDRPMFPSPPLLLIQTAVNRKTRQGDVIGAHNALSVEDALKAMTLNPAWQVFEEDNIGSLEAGKFADLVVLAENPLRVDPDHLGEIQVVETWVGGRLVYAAEAQGEDK